MDRRAGILREEKALEVDDKWTVRIPMSHPVMALPDLPPNARLNI